MSSDGLQASIEKMRAAGVGDAAIDTFAHYYEQLREGASGMLPESDIEPVEELPALDDLPEGDPAIVDTAVVLKLNGGLGTSMGMTQAKSLIEAKEGQSFLDIVVGQVLALRERFDARVPLVLMNSFATRDDSLEALRRHPEIESDVPLDFLQNKVPKIDAETLQPVSWEADPSLEWAPPGHGDLYTALRGTGLLQRLVDQGYERVFVSNSDNLGAVPDGRIAGWFAESGAPFAIEAVRRTPSDRKGGHFARRKSDGRIVLRETAQTSKKDQAALADLDRHRFSSTNNLWFDLRAMTEALDARHGILGLPLIRNVKTVDPADPSTPEVIQIETAMGAAIEVFEGACIIEVGRDRFVPVKTTDDLLVLRSDVYDIGSDFVLDPAGDAPFVDLDARYYKLVPEFERRFPDGAPSLREASSLKVSGDWTFGAKVKVVGDVTLETGAAERIPAGSVLEHD